MPVPAEVETQIQQLNEVAPPGPSPQAAPEESSQEENGVASNGTASPVEEEVNGESGEQQKRECKLFVGGLNQSINEASLCAKLEKFGEITDIKIMRDPYTKQSRGFGFVTFKTPDAINKVLKAHKDEPLLIDNRKIDPKEAVPAKKLSTLPTTNTTTNTTVPNAKVKRIFVGGISTDSSKEDLEDYFKEFGKIAECQLLYDRATNRHRGFGFVSFEDAEPAEKTCNIQYHVIRGKKVEVKVAQTKEALAMQNGKARTNSRNNYGNFVYNSYPNQFYPSSPSYAPDYMAMGGYPAMPPYMIGNGMRKPPRGAKTQDYPQQFAGYMFGGWADPSHMPGGYYGPAAGYGGMPIQMIEQFQGMALGGYPMGQYPPISHAGMGPYNDGNSTGSPHELSPTATSASVNTFNSQVPVYTGSSYNGSNGPQSY